MAKFGRTFTVFLAAIIINSVHCLSFDLDTADYDKTIWTIGGSAVFIEHGRSLRTSFKEFLPAHFEYTKFDLTEGIWVVVPEAVPCSKSSVGSVNWDEDDMDLLHEDYADSSVNGSSETTTKATTTTTAPPTTTSIPTPACYTQASASFKCTLKSQLDSSVKVTYNIGGNAKLTIRSKSKPISISGHSRKTSGWEDADNEIDGNTVRISVWNILIACAITCRKNLTLPIRF